MVLGHPGCVGDGVSIKGYGGGGRKILTNDSNYYIEETTENHVRVHSRLMSMNIIVCYYSNSDWKLLFRNAIVELVSQKSPMKSRRIH